MNLFNDPFLNNYYSAVLSNDKTSVDTLFSNLGIQNNLGLIDTTQFNAQPQQPQQPQQSQQQFTPNINDTDLLQQHKDFNRQLMEQVLKNKEVEINKVDGIQNNPEPEIKQEEQTEIKTVEMSKEDLNIKKEEPAPVLNTPAPEVNTPVQEVNVPAPEVNTPVVNKQKFSDLDLSNLDLNSLDLNNLDFT